MSRSKLIPAHLAKHEMEVLDHLQGGVEKHKKTGIKSYSRLEKMLRNPHIKALILKHAHSHATGGEAGHPLRYHLLGDIADASNEQHRKIIEEIQRKAAAAPQSLTEQEIKILKQHGRHGDRDLGLIGPNLMHLFNKMSGHATSNPHDGYPEYFNLSSVLGGLWNTLKSGAGSIGRMFGMGGGSRSQAPRRQYHTLTDEPSYAGGPNFRAGGMIPEEHGIGDFVGSMWNGMKNMFGSKSTPKPVASAPFTLLSGPKTYSQARSEQKGLVGANRFDTSKIDFNRTPAPAMINGKPVTSNMSYSGPQRGTLADFNANKPQMQPSKGHRFEIGATNKLPYPGAISPLEHAKNAAASSVYHGQKAGNQFIKEKLPYGTQTIGNKIFNWATDKVRDKAGLNPDSI